jgi:hypothetical protein
MSPFVLSRAVPLGWRADACARAGAQRELQLVQGLLADVEAERRAQVVSASEDQRVVESTYRGGSGEEARERSG